jgi:hypothetical protein
MPVILGYIHMQNIIRSTDVILKKNHVRCFFLM